MDTVELVWVTILAHYGQQQRERAAALARAALAELAGGADGVGAPTQACPLGLVVSATQLAEPVAVAVVVALAVHVKVMAQRGAADA